MIATTKKQYPFVIVALIALAAGVGLVNAQRMEQNAGPIVTCNIAAPPSPRSENSEPQLLACGGYSAVMRLYSSVAGRSTAFISHGAKQANSRNVNVEKILDSGKVKRQNKMIYISLGGYQVRVSSTDGAIVTVVKL